MTNRMIDLLNTATRIYDADDYYELQASINEELGKTRATAHKRDKFFDDYADNYEDEAEVVISAYHDDTVWDIVDMMADRKYIIEEWL